MENLGRVPDEVQEGVQWADSVVAEFLSVLVFLWHVGLVPWVDGHHQDDPEDDGQESGDKVVQHAPQTHLTARVDVHGGQT